MLGEVKSLLGEVQLILGEAPQRPAAGEQSGLARPTSGDRRSVTWEQRRPPAGEQSGLARPATGGR